jgi:hypothetical protein
MGEILTWTLGVFAVLGGPMLLIVLAEVRRQRRQRASASGRDDRASAQPGPG